LGVTVPYCEEDVIGDYPCSLYDECTEGHYCPLKSSVEQNCDVGTYQPFPRAKSVDECAPCPSGNYCDELALSLGENRYLIKYFWSGLI
jgi:hypothetical protein